MVCGETGRNPLFVNIYVKCITFCFRILKMSPDRLAFKVYTMLLHLHEETRGLEHPHFAIFDEDWVKRFRNSLKTDYYLHTNKSG